ncbi:MAG: polyprenol monophosphomannose synthase [candidate division KSB1 bacterium]|nr:polyprenol monophosphomannose synthase [candidate division KSB1 bacterium]
MKVLIIVPTFNERENIERLLSTLLALPVNGLEVLVVDDASPDGTGQIVEAIAEKEPRVHLIRRPGKMGLGSAYIAGFRYGLANHFDLIFEMDADFSHDPHEIPKMIRAADNYDVVVGSRYLHGITVVNWPLKRLLLSMVANLYTRLITGLPVEDCTAGFVCYHRRVLESINLDRIISDGYSFQIEMKFRAWKFGFRIGEVPIIFVDRHLGVSKMSKRIVYEAVWMVWRLKILSILHKLK